MKRRIDNGEIWALVGNWIRRHGTADQVRDEIISLGWGTTHYLMLDDVAVVVRHPDGSFTLDREAFPAASNVLGLSVVGFVAGNRLRAGRWDVGLAESAILSVTVRAMPATVSRRASRPCDAPAW